MLVFSKLNNYTFRAICRNYSRYLVRDKPADPIYRFLCSLEFYRIHRYWPNFLKPSRFSEKLWARRLIDRNPLHTVLSDKLRVRSLVESRIGSDHLIPILWQGQNPELIPFAELPDRFVIKASHGSGYNILVSDKTNLNQQSVKATLKAWLSENYCHDRFLGTEWGYRNVPPTIIIEQFIGHNDQPPADYKFFCFGGRIEVLMLHLDRFTCHKLLTLDRNFKPHDIQYVGDIQWKGIYTRPTNFDEMIKLVELLAEGIDFVRVDIYDVNGHIFFGEYTPYPGPFAGKFTSDRFDIEFGLKWRWNPQ